MSEPETIAGWLENLDARLARIEQVEQMLFVHMSRRPPATVNDAAVEAFKVAFHDHTACGGYDESVRRGIAAAMRSMGVMQ